MNTIISKSNIILCSKSLQIELFYFITMSHYNKLRELYVVKGATISDFSDIQLTYSTIHKYRGSMDYRYTQTEDLTGEIAI